ncbi:MAG: ABC transporter substrate-binding protein [archaeon]
MKKILNILIAALIIAGMFLVTLLGMQITGHTVKENQYRVGAILPMSGTFSYYGERSLVGIQIVNKNYPEIRVTVEDDQGDIEKAVTAATKLITIDKVNALVTVRSSTSSAVAEIAQQYHVPLIYSSTINLPAEQNSYAFKNFVNIEKDCEALANGLQGKKGRLLGYNLDSTQTCINGFENKGFNLHEELFSKGETDFRTSLTKIKQANPDFIVIRADNKVLPNIFKQMKELDIKNIQLVCPHATGAGCREEATIQYYPEYFENALGSDSYFIETQKMKELNIEDPIDLTFSSYENVNILFPTIIKCEGDNKCIVSELHSGTFKGLDGPIRFDSNGIAERETNLIEFKDGEWKSIS